MAIAIASENRHAASIVEPAPSADVIDSAWSLDLAAASAPTPIVPDLNVELLVQCAKGAAPQILIIGPQYQSRLEHEDGFVIGFGVAPMAARSFLGIDLDRLGRDAVPLADLGWRTFDPPTEDMLQTPDAARRALWRIITKRRADCEIRIDPIVAEAVARLSTADAPSVAAATRPLGVSERTLRRRFKAALGVGPKRAERLVRLKRVLYTLAAPERAPLAEIAEGHGYFDQAHFTNELRELTGMTPTALAKRLYAHRA